ncbi:hypothetical protein [Agromyces neolithicus]|uniref:ABC transporter n=1 Tax=Agromyces neolithicus TaxID=269420 RepID=A0ABP4YE92_9MICO
MSSTTPGSEPGRADDASHLPEETPVDATADESTLFDATADESTPETAPDEMAPDQSTPAAAHDESAPDETSPDDADVDESARERPADEEGAVADKPEPEPEPESESESEPESESESESEPDPTDREPEPEPEASASPLDEAVARANAGAAASDDDGVDDADVTPAPVAADSVRRETYVPASTAATSAAVGAATLAPEPEPLYVAPTPAPQTVYVQAPNPPKAKGNRGFGILVALIGTVLFALLYAAIGYLVLLTGQDPSTVFAQFLTRAVFWVPVAAFFVGFMVLAAIINRGPWWTYAVFGLLVAALVYFSYIGGALLTVEAWTLSFEEASEFVSQRWLDPFAIIAAAIAREIPIWLGGWIAARGRAVTERNRLALEEYDRQIAAGPQVQRS